MSGHWEDRSYATIPYPPAAEVWPLVLEDADSCRKSLDGSLVLVKWDGDTPAPLAGVTVYDHAAILTLLNGTDWSEPMPDPPE